MSYSVVAHTISGTNSGGTTSSGINTSGANLLVVAVSYFQPITFSDAVGGNSNTWTPLTAHAGSVGNSRFYYCIPAHVGSGHTFTTSAANSFSSLAVIALSGAAASSPFDQEAGASGFTPGSVTPSEDNEIVLTSVLTETSGEDADMVNGGFTISDFVANSNSNYFGISLAYLIQTAAAAANPTWSGTVGTGAGSNATFKAAAAGGVFSPWWYYGSQAIGQGGGF